MAADNRLLSDLVESRLGLHAVGLGVTLLMLFGGYTLVLQPLQDRYDHSLAKQAALSEFAVSQRDVDSDHRTARLALEREEGQLRELIDRIPAGSREADFLGQITALAETSGLEIRRYNPGQPVQREMHSTLVIGVEAQATYTALCKFLDGLADLPRLCRVTQLSVHNDDPKLDRYPVTMQIQVYFAPLNQLAQLNGEADHE